MPSPVVHMTVAVSAQTKALVGLPPRLYLAIGRPDFTLGVADKHANLLGLLCTPVS